MKWNSIRLGYRYLSLIAAAIIFQQLASGSPKLGGDDPTGPPPGPPPCPTIEFLCDGPPPKPEDPLQQLCQCGPGQWIRVTKQPQLDPFPEIHSRWSGSDNFVAWQTSSDRVAHDGQASVNVTIAGTSRFWHAGSKSGSHVAQYSGGWTEQWQGTFPACARSVMLAAVGSGALTIGGSCAARLGCSAATTATASGGAMSRGNATATVTGLEIHGAVSFDELVRESKINGNFGADITLSSPGLSGRMSSNQSWTVKGEGSAAGSLSFTIAPDRTYCALTNLPIMATWNGIVAVSASVSVDENGSAAGSAGSTLLLQIN